MNFYDIVIGILLVFLGGYLIKLTDELTTPNKYNGLTFKIGVSGLCSIIIGVGLIIRGINIF